jgi:2-polyprenyl-6-methoxyphenol hydroxylase-like FAD-dependent oxidoreductase
MFYQSVIAVAPTMADRVHEIKTWEQVKLLEVTVDRLQKWYRPGLLCIGDCAHAMSPIGGVGINLAVQDAVASANILAPAFLKGTVNVADLAAPGITDAFHSTYSSLHSKSRCKKCVRQAGSLKSTRIF